MTCRSRIHSGEWLAVPWDGEPGGEQAIRTTLWMAPSPVPVHLLPRGGLSLNAQLETPPPDEVRYENCKNRIDCLASRGCLECRGGGAAACTASDATRSPRRRGGGRGHRVPWHRR